ncbi:MAG: alpha/beta fold hydrolase [Halobacteria archaeon]
MKLKKYLKYGAIATVGAATAAEIQYMRAGRVEPALPGRNKKHMWNGHDVYYDIGGDREDDTLALLHGISAASSSHEWSEVYDAVTEEYNVVSPDLPGFGCSDRPSIEYSDELYTDFVADFLKEFDEPDVVASSLTSAYVLEALDDEDVEIGSLNLVCPTKKAGPDSPKEFVRKLFRSPVIGNTLFAGIASKPSIRHFAEDHGYYDIDNYTEEMMEYDWRTSHQRDARFAPASFVSGHLNSDVDMARKLREFDGDAALIWGENADLTPVEEGRVLADEAEVDLEVIRESKLLPHVEHPEKFVDSLHLS